MSLPLRINQDANSEKSLASSERGTSRLHGRHTFLIEEFKALRSEIELYLAEIRRLERNTIIAVGTIWAWLLHERVTDARVWSIPIVLTLHSGAPDHRG